MELASKPPTIVLNPQKRRHPANDTRITSEASFNMAQNVRPEYRRRTLPVCQLDGVSCHRPFNVVLAEADLLYGTPRIGSLIESILDIMVKQKSVLLSLVLTFFLGPFGMLYSTVPGGLIMLVLYIGLGIVTFGWAIAVLHPIAMIWGAIAADRSNK